MKSDMRYSLAENETSCRTEQGSSAMLKGLPAVLLLMVCFLLGCQRDLFQLSMSPELPVIPGAYYTGTDSCIPCHDDIYDNYNKTIHARIKASEGGALHGTGCEACHGPGSMHVQKKGGVDNIHSFSRLDAAAGSEICLQCHRGMPAMDWRANVHVLSGVGCNECHKSHKITAPKMVYMGDPEICFSCHQEKRAQHLLPSHHPLREKKMKCSSCHNNHGSENNNLVQSNLNDVCAECHAEYQGPFVFEHDPVVEDCSICHDPHGTIANNLLKQSQPFLCLRCHRGHRENMKTGPHPTAAALLTSCTQCHSQVHGSDLPSQVSGHGLTR